MPETIYRVGIIGTGFGASVHLPAVMRHPRTEPRFISSIRPGRSAQVARQAGIAACPWTELVAHPEVDVVVVATNPELHTPVAMTALKAGKHVLLEKPMALNLAEAESLLREATLAQRVAVIHHQHRYFPARLVFEELLRQGRVGKLLHVRWRVTRGRRQELQSRRHGWLDDAARGGGFLGASGSHILDQLLVWFGPVAEVFCRFFHHVPERLDGMASAEDGFLLFLQHRSGVSVEVSFVNGSREPEETTVNVLGSEGTLTLVDDQAVVLVEHGERQAVPVPEWQGAAASVPPDAPYLLRPTLAFWDRLTALLDGQTLRSDEVADFSQGVAVQRLMDACRLSAAERRLVSLA